MISFFVRYSKRFLISFLFPLLSWWVYLDEVDSSHRGTEFLLVTIVAIVVSVSIFVSADLIATVELGSRASIVGILFWVLCLVVGIVSWIHNPESWGSPLIFFCIWVPAIRIACKTLKDGFEWKFLRKMVTRISAQAP